MTFVLYLFSVAFYPWNGKLEKWWRLIRFCLILCTVVLMQITGIYFYCVSLYVLFKINQPCLFNLSSEKGFCVLSHSNHLPLDGLHYSDISFQSWNIQNDIPDEGKSLIYIVTLYFLLFSPPCSSCIITFCLFVFTVAVHCPDNSANPGPLHSFSHNIMLLYYTFLIFLQCFVVVVVGIVLSCIQKNME